MSLIAAILDWEDPSPPTEDIGRLLSALPERTPDGRRFSRLPHALLGFGRRVVRPAEETEIQPRHDAERQLCAVGDLRLDNREELRAALGGGRELDSDIAILLAAYHRWGEQTAEKLIGDFAFVIWDARRREVYAARDPFGIRSLCYWSRTGRMVFATDAAQFLALPEVDRSPDPETVVGYLAWTNPRYGPTFFRAIRNVRPGHYLRARAGFTREVEYFGPPSDEVRYARSEDYERRFFELFERSVRDRIDSKYPIVAHLSGGLDSSSIVCAANRIYRRDPGNRVRFVTASAVFPGEAYDETPFIDAVARHVTFPARRWDGNVPSGREFSHPAVGIPGTSVTLAGGSTGDIEAAADIGARVMLTGSMGDLVTGEIGLFNELLRRRRWVTICEQVWRGGTPRERRIRRFFLRRALGEEAPTSVVRAWRALKPPAAPVPVPEWLRPDLHDVWVGPQFRSPPRLNVGSNGLQQGIWRFLRWPWSAWGVDFMSSYTGSAGVEIRYPYLDARLVSFMLAIPYEHRLLGGLRRSLHRRALAEILPEAIAQRSSKPNFNKALVRWGHASASAIRDLVEGSSWYSDRFVDQRQAQGLLRRLAAKPPDAADREGWLYLRAIVNIETWHRAVFRYPLTKEILPMSETPATGDAGSEVREGGDGLRPTVPYEAPKLTGVGNVRSLLATGTASVLDGDPPPAADPQG